MKNRNLVEWILFLVFTIIGIAFMIIGGVWYYIVKEKENSWISTQATIIDIQKPNVYSSKQSHIVWVEFLVNEKNYQVQLSEYSSNMKIGKNITVFYNPANPEEIMTNNFLGYLIFICIGALFTIIGLIPITLMFLKAHKKKQLMQNGKKIEATIDNVSFKMNYSVNGKHPYILECSYVDPIKGIVYFFKSDSIWYPVEVILEKHNITTISVYVDNQNFKKYYVDITKFEKYLGN